MAHFLLICVGFSFVYVYAPHMHAGTHGGQTEYWITWKPGTSITG